MNRSRTLTIDLKKEDVAWQVIECLHALKKNFVRLYHNNSDNAYTICEDPKAYSYSPIRENVPAQPLVCGQLGFDNSKISLVTPILVSRRRYVESKYPGLSKLCLLVLL